LALFCGDDNNPTTVNPPDTKTKSYGTFKIRLIAAVVDTVDPTNNNPAYTVVEGGVNDGPAVPEYLFEKIEESGPCKLYKTLLPFCDKPCGGNGKCIAENTCQQYPSKISVGDVTVNGFKLSGQKISFTMSPSTALNYQMVGVSMDYPPFTEGDTVTFAATGTTTAPAFTTSVRGITPLVISNEEITLEDDKPITFHWEKPKVAGVSTMNIRINISYHGGTKGEIMVDCEDNGEVTVPAAMIMKLKSWGMAGWPIADMTRKSIISSDSTKPRIIIESMVTKGLNIPGIISCNDDEHCPNGGICKDRKCQ
jgi:hypothetical protein